MPRYRITTDFADDARPRLRTALRLMGGQAIRIEEVADAAAAPIKPDNVPASAEAVAVAALFGRAPDKLWSDCEIKLFKQARKRGVLTTDETALLAKYYKAERAKGEEGRHRRDLATFLRNVDGEIDRAKAYANRKHRTGPGWAPAGEHKVIPMPAPELTLEQQEEASRFQAMLDERKRREAQA